MNGRWLFTHIFAVLIASLAANASMLFSLGGLSEFVQPLMLILLMAVAGVFIHFIFRALTGGFFGRRRNLTIAPVEITTETTLSDLLFTKRQGSRDTSSGIEIYSAISIENILTPITGLFAAYSMSIATLALASGSGITGFTDYLFLLAQTTIVFVSIFVLAMIISQASSIYKFLLTTNHYNRGYNNLDNNSKGERPMSKSISTPFSFLQLLFGGSQAKSGTNKKASRKIKDLSRSELDETLKPALDVLSGNTSSRFKNLYANMINLSKEVDSAMSDFDLPASTFDAELSVINDVVNVFIPTTVENCRKSFQNTTLTNEMITAFRTNLERPIATKIRKYEMALENANKHILEVRLSTFDMSEIDPYINEAHRTHNRIAQQSGDTTNKHMVISQSIINELIPSLVKTWSLARSGDQKESIKSQFVDVVAFLQKQLSILESNDFASKNQQEDLKLLTLDSSEGNLSEINQQIGKNKRYIEMLNKEWN